MAGTENCKSLCQIAKKSKKHKSREGTCTSSEDSTFTRKKAEGHSSVTTRTERKQTNGGVWCDGHNLNIKSTLCRHKYDHTTGACSKKGRSLHHRKGKASCQPRQMNQASSSRYIHKKRDEFKGSSGYGQNRKGKCLKTKSCLGDVEVCRRKYRTDHGRKCQLNMQDSKWYKQRRGGKMNKQKCMAITGTAEGELSCRNRRLDVRKRKKRKSGQSKSHQRGSVSKLSEERNDGEEGSGHKDTSVASPNQQGSNPPGVRQVVNSTY